MALIVLFVFHGDWCVAHSEEWILANNLSFICPYSRAGVGRAALVGRVAFSVPARKRK